ncbi:hypothetical protein ACSTS3_22655 [Aquimarina muelleri]|uniref:hypothetical protein n=1 Tax=Aquimarina muelleri TaxID=279356 RepID=UPI003F686E2F
MEPEFKVIGDADILQDIKINLEISRETQYPFYESAMVTLYDKGKKYSPQIEHAIAYGVYVSYKKTYVNTFGFENINQWANDFVHHLYVYKNKDSVYINYIGRKSEIDEFKYHKGTPIISLNDFYKKENITTQKEEQIINDKFFEFYDPLNIKYMQETQEIEKIEEEKD